VSSQTLTVPRPVAERRRGEPSLFGALGIESLTIVFQPIVSLRDLRMVGLEALARFRGVREEPPDAWFARAETMGLGELLEVRAVRAAIQRLPEIPEPLFLSINVSPGTAGSPRLRRTIDGPGRRIVLEITEHTPVRDYDRLRVAVDELRRLGARVAVDDAGAGFAGLSHVVRVVPDLIKLDIGMIAGIERDPAKRSLVSAVSTLARATGSAVVAEGIETREQLVTLRTLGIDFGQGYLLGRPTSLDELLFANLGRPNPSEGSVRQP
jgi:EAL domain-containing protein (putative c-di-GMP-specific phosphodiesterase class I)